MARDLGLRVLSKPDFSATVRWTSLRVAFLGPFITCGPHSEGARPNLPSHIGCVTFAVAQVPLGVPPRSQ
jgi:hypothetical protein